MPGCLHNGILINAGRGAVQVFQQAKLKIIVFLAADLPADFVPVVIPAIPCRDLPAVFQARAGPMVGLLPAAVAERAFRAARQEKYHAVFPLLSSYSIIPFISFFHCGPDKPTRAINAIAVFLI